MIVGDVVRVLYPFTVAFPDKYPIEYITADGACAICGDREFDLIYLEKV